MNIDDFNKALGILCAWREADDQGQDGMRAVLHVIDNRAKLRGQTWAQVVYAKAQFDGMVFLSPDLYRVPVEGNIQFEYLSSIVDSVYDGTDLDNSQGAMNYYANSIAPPYWVDSMTFTVQIDNQLFYK